MNTRKLKKDSVRNIVVATRLTYEEHKIFKKLCREKKVTFARLIRFSIEETLKKN